MQTEQEPSWLSICMYILTAWPNLLRDYKATDMRLNAKHVYACMDYSDCMLHDDGFHVKYFLCSQTIVEQATNILYS